MESEQHSGVFDVNELTATTSEQGNSSSDWPRKDPSSSYENRPGDILKNLQNVSYIYRRDIVRQKAKSGIGIVTEVAGDSDSYSSIADGVEDGKDDMVGSNEEGDAADNDNNNYKQIPLTADLVRVLWMDGSETTEGTNDVEIVDRGFLHGDYVASAFDPTGQIGVVADININVDLLAQDGSVLKGKPSKELRRVRNFTVGDIVVLGRWLGKIKYVYDDVTVQFDDGSMCKVMKAGPKDLKQVGQYFLEDEHSPCSVGQRVKATSSSVFEKARWLSGLWKASHLVGTVTKVTEVAVYIYWFSSDGYGPDPFTSPDVEQSPKNLKLLSCFSLTKWQLGDWCLLPLSQDSSSTLLTKELFKLDSNDSAQDKSESSETDDEFYEVITAEEYVKTELMENTSEVSLSKNAETWDNSASAEEVVYETWPIHRKKILVVRKKTESFQRALVIVSTHSKVDVAWQDGNLNRGMDSTSLIRFSPGDHDFVSEQYVRKKFDISKIEVWQNGNLIRGQDSTSLITIDSPGEKAADSEYRYDGIVKSVDSKKRTAYVKWLKPVATAKDPLEFDKEEFVSVYDLEGRPAPEYDYTYRDLVVQRPPISSPESSPAHDMSTDFSFGNITGLKDGYIEVTWADGKISTVDPRAVYVFRRNDDESNYTGSEISDVAARWETVEDDIVSVDNAEDHGRDADDTRSEIESELLEVAEALCNFKLPQSDAPACEELTFERFDIVRDPIDHNFLGTQGQYTARKWLKKLYQDWKILLHNLPEGVYVRVYEDRIDLLRAAIVGAYGTPYQDGLFFFDFQLTSEYPDVAPSAYYHCGGWRINPNLYEEGKICLSLLNTWRGRGNEVWDPSTSSILQVLVSLQGLVLNSKPYFNEAGYDKQVGTAQGEKNSLSYNENIFVLICKTMMYQMQKPPKDFEDLVIQHYRERGYYILKACDAYMKGHLIGSLAKDASVSDDSNTDSNSEGFKLMLSKVVPGLFTALKAVGANCKEFENLSQI